MAMFVDWEDFDNGDDIYRLYRNDWFAIDAFGEPLDGLVGYRVQGTRAAYGQELAIVAAPLLCADYSFVVVRIYANPSRLRQLEDEQVDPEVAVYENCLGIPWSTLRCPWCGDHRHIPCVMASGKTRFLRE